MLLCEMFSNNAFKYNKTKNETMKAKGLWKDYMDNWA